jgi:hypothetical protein
VGDGIHTLHRARHWSRPDPEGPRRLLWASMLGEMSGDGISEDSRLLLPRLLRSQRWIANELSDLGEQRILEITFRNATEITTFYYRLYNDTLVDTDTLATAANEMSMTGYPGTNDLTQDSTGFPTSALDSGDWAVTGRTRTWTNTGGSASTSVNTLVLASAASGTTGDLLAWAALSATRTLQVNDSLDASMKLKAA